VPARACLPALMTRPLPPCTPEPQASPSAVPLPAVCSDRLRLVPRRDPGRARGRCSARDAADAVPGLRQTSRGAHTQAFERDGGRLVRCQGPALALEDGWTLARAVAPDGELIRGAALGTAVQQWALARAKKAATARKASDDLVRLANSLGGSGAPGGSGAAACPLRHQGVAQQGADCCCCP